jgi:UDP-N-acetylglucosamine--N-acetylmuramyl-(pentapeptide) pyrophosphoryl-undecaprenol N-acetylglucosamine transferase
MLRAAATHKIPTLIQEQNSYAGLTNKILAKKANRICVAYDHMEQYFPIEKIVLTGNPVRKDIERIELKRNKALAHFDLDANKTTVLITGGSLGARTINDSILSGLENFRKAGLQLIWQAGRFYYKELKESVKVSGGAHVRLYEFINEMDLAYSAADLVVARAGALTISELCLAGKPAILIPSPNVAEDHQTKNARALVAENAAQLVSDGEAPDRLSDEILHLASNAVLREKLGKNIKKLGKPQAAENIAMEVLKLAG